MALRKRGYPERGGFPQKRGGSNHGRNYDSADIAYWHMIIGQSFYR